MPERVGLAAAVAGPPRAAVGFLTRLPVGDRARLRPEDLVRGAVLFPLVGATIGAVVTGVMLALAPALPALVAATVAVAVELALTGALHLDGLADSADGLAGRDRERALAIMRDHALGTYGGAALAVDLLAKTAALAALAQADALPAVVAAYAASRAAPLPLAAALPYARADGTGRLLADRARPAGAVAAVALAAALALAAAEAVVAAATLACLLAVVATVGTLARRRLGGVTGDVMGAAIELTVTVALVAAVAWSS